MFKNSFPLINLTLCLALLGPTACGLPDADADIEGPIETAEDELRQAQPASHLKRPAPLSLDRLGGVVGTCSHQENKAVAELRYRATRGHRTDSVMLTLASENGYFSINHRRNGHDMGTVRIDGMGWKEVDSDSFLKPGRERFSALLVAELASTGVMAKLPDALRCIGSAPAGELVRDGQTYQFYGWCEFGWDALVVVTATVATAAEVACCATAGTATVGLACYGCIGAGEAIKITAGVVSGSGRANCERGPDPRDEELRNLKERLQEQETWRDREIKRRLDEDDQKALEEALKKEKEAEEEKEKAKMGT